MNFELFIIMTRRIWRLTYSLIHLLQCLPKDRHSKGQSPDQEVSLEFLAGTKWLRSQHG